MPGVADGKLAQPPFVQLAQPVSVRIAGVSAQVTYAGVAPGLITGVLQINAVVPQAIAADKAAPIDFSVGSATSQAGVTVAIE